MSRECPAEYFLMHMMYKAVDRFTRIQWSEKWYPILTVDNRIEFPSEFKQVVHCCRDIDGKESSSSYHAHSVYLAILLLLTVITGKQRHCVTIFHPI